jgi:hypothetical protein
MTDGFLVGELVAKSGVGRKALRLYEARRILPTPRRTPPAIGCNPDTSLFSASSGARDCSAAPLGDGAHRRAPPLALRRAFTSAAF